MVYSKVIAAFLFFIVFLIIMVLKSKKEKIIKASLQFSVSNILLRISQIIQGLFVANILGPTMFGIKNAIQLISDYGYYGHFGSLSIFSKERQKLEFDDTSKRDYYTNIIFTFLMLVSVIIIFISIMCFFFLNYSFLTRMSILIIGFLIPVTLFINFMSIIFQSKGDFQSLSVINITQAVLVLISIILFVYFLGVIGYFLGSLVGFFCILLFRWLKIDYTPKLVFNFKTIFLLLKQGLVLFLFSLSFLFFFSIDRFFIIYNFGATELGYYAIGVFFANLMYFFMATLVIPFIPKIFQNIASKTELYKYIIIPTKITNNIIYFFVFLVLFLYPFLIFILPKYSAGFLYVNILIFSILFYPLLITNYFVGANKEKFLLWYTCLFVLFAAILDFCVVIFKLPPIFIAVATMVTFFFYGVSMNLIGYKDLLGSYKKALKEVFNCLWPLGYALVGYGLLWLLAHFWLYDFINYYIVKAIQAVLFTIWYAPILWKIEKEHRILKMIWEGIKRKLKGKDQAVDNLQDTIS